MHRNQVVRTLSLCLMSLLLLALPASAEVRLPGFFGDHMVLQREMPLRIWGWANEGEKVTVTLAGNQVTTTANDEGKWQVELPAMKASKDSVSLKVAGTNVIEIRDVLIGEVWLCSGQSNMEWTVGISSNAQQEIASGNHPLIRHMKVAHRPSMAPIDDLQSQWQICTPEVVGEFTACGYFMAKHLQERLDVPIGLINSSWGGTRIEPWTPPIGFQQVPALSGIFQSVMGRTPGTDAHRGLLGNHLAALEAWIAKSRDAMQHNQAVEASPAFPDALKPFTSHQDPTMLYNGMIHALVGYPIRGAIWYQGESNHGEGMLYVEKQRALVEGWRNVWNQGDFPFYYVQIAPFRYGEEDPEILARFWEAQSAAQVIPNTGMVVINDIATLDDIHPPNKQDVGQRLALLALKNDYGFAETIAQSPEMDAMELLGDRLKIRFRNTGGGLKTRDGKSPSYFELIGPDSRGYHAADAMIDSDTVTLSSSEVKQPVAFRYAWHKLAEPNLSGATGLPVGAFRGGVEPDFLSQVSVQDDYQLVYELDLSKLGKEIRYDVDHSQQIGPFDRVGYLLELNSEHSGEQKVFVSVEAFTDSASKIGIPTISSGAVFQQPVKSMEVFSNVSGLAKGLRIEGGNIEFWPNNYGPANRVSVANASNDTYDFGDDPGPPNDGYGSMQIHNPGARQTVFAINHWGSGAAADIGIGNSPGQQSDWTFTGNAGSYSQKRLRIYVRPTQR